MGVNTITGDVFKGFTIGEEGQPGRLPSKSYGVYITGEGVYDAPERDAEMITIPGRNGTFYKDNGRWNNVLVTYKAGMFGDEQTDFADGIRRFRNAMAKRTGYQKLYDDYNTDEYRLAVYKGGLDIDAVAVGKAGTFDITFDCKPQRFLKTGDINYAISNGYLLTNQGEFPCYPLLSFTSTGSGTISIGSQTIQVINEQLGETLLSLTKSTTSYGSPYSDTVTIGNPDVMNTSDTFTFKGATANIQNLCSYQVLWTTYATGQDLEYGGESISNKSIIYNISDDAGVTFTKGTSSTVTKSANVVIHLAYTGDVTQAVTLTYVYNGSNQITITWSTTVPSGVSSRTIDGTTTYTGLATSSVYSLGGTTVYIDLEIGEAYKLVNGKPVSLNNFVNLGATIPYLPTGSSTISYSNTITDFKMKMRWFRI